LGIAALLGLSLCAPVRTAHAIGQARYILQKPAPGAFPMVQAGVAAAIYVDSADWPGVARAAADLQSDIVRVTGVTPLLLHTTKGLGRAVIIIGTIGRSPILDQLVREKKIDTAQVAGKWEAFVIQVVAHPCQAFPARSSSPAAISAAPFMAPTTSPNKSASHPGITGRMCPPSIKTPSS